MKQRFEIEVVSDQEYYINHGLFNRRDHVVVGQEMVRDTEFGKWSVVAKVEGNRLVADYVVLTTPMINLGLKLPVGSKMQNTLEMLDDGRVKAHVTFVDKGVTMVKTFKKKSGSGV